MRTSLLLIALLFSSAFAYSAEPDSTGMAGDHLDLNAVLELFKDSESVEEFENSLNSEKVGVNNLDLNNDGHVDYIRVIDHADGDAHSLTLQVPYSDKEAQDVAVIEIERNGDETTAQIVGDEELYGEDYIVEPTSDDANKATNVSAWTPVRHIYSPRYVIWVSPWRFGYYPKWYRPWNPIAWHVYHGKHRHHHTHYRRSHIYRCPRAHQHYNKHKVHSVAFHNHHHPIHHKGGKAQNQGKVNNGKANHSKQVIQKKNTGNKATPKPSPSPNHAPSNKVKSTSPGFKSSSSKPTKRPGGTKSSTGGGQKSSSPNKKGGGRH